MRAYALIIKVRRTAIRPTSLAELVRGGG